MSPGCSGQVMGAAGAVVSSTAKHAAANALFRGRGVAVLVQEHPGERMVNVGVWCVNC
jgi:hypothetical protein